MGADENSKSPKARIRAIEKEIYVLKEKTAELAGKWQGSETMQHWLAL